MEQMEQIEQTKAKEESKGNVIEKSHKELHVSFKEDFAEIINVESYKEYNILNDKDEYINQLENNNDEKNIDEIDDDEEGEEKFDINNYNPTKIEKLANHDPHAFSRANRCIIL